MSKVSGETGDPSGMMNKKWIRTEWTTELMRLKKKIIGVEEFVKKYGLKAGTEKKNEV